MNTKRVTIYHAFSNGELKRVSLSPITLDEVREFHCFDEHAAWVFEPQIKDVPFTTGDTRLWEGGWPHVHYSCSHCESGAHNFDLNTEDDNPRLASCDYMGVNFYTLVAWTASETG